MYILETLSFLIWPAIIIGIIYLVARGKGNNNHAKNTSLSISVSKEDAVSQWFFLLSIFFFGITLLALNRDLGTNLNGQTIILISSIVGLLISYKYKTLSTLIFSVFGMLIWWIIEAGLSVSDSHIKGSVFLSAFSFIALLFYSLGYLHEGVKKYRKFSYVYTVLGIIFITLILFIFSSKFGLSALDDLTKGESIMHSWKLSISLILFFTSILTFTLTALKNKLILLPETIAVFILTFIFGLIVFLPQQHLFVGSYYNAGYGSPLTFVGILWAIAFNFLVFFELLGLIFSGYLRREEWLINLGTFFLFILIVIKYFDWFFTFLDKSLFFIGAGILLFAVGFGMEKSRRFMIANIKNQDLNTKAL